MLAGFPNSESRGGKPKINLSKNAFFAGLNGGNEKLVLNDTGSAARFFYCPKASKHDRSEGLDTPSNHPTVKPTNLMRWLCRLITPPGGVVLDPFTGSGSTLKAAVLEGFQYIGIEREAEYVAIARARVAAVQPQLALC